VTDPNPEVPAREAVAQLFKEHGDLIYHLGLRMCGNPAAAEDLVQETFLRALQSWDHFEGRSKASTWLYTIASRACQRMKRRRAGEPLHLESYERLLPAKEEGIALLPSGDSVEDRVALGEVTDTVRQAVAGLPPQFRFPFVLKEMFDFSLDEVARVLGVKEATVKTRLHRARLRVRREIAQGLPSRPHASSDHQRDECLALLKAKQESLDHGTPFPIPEEEVCNRCRAVFATLDLGREACLRLSEGRMPDRLRAEVASAIA